MDVDAVKFDLSWGVLLCLVIKSEIPGWFGQLVSFRLDAISFNSFVSTGNGIVPTFHVVPTFRVESRWRMSLSHIIIHSPFIFTNLSLSSAFSCYIFIPVTSSYFTVIIPLLHTHGSCRLWYFLPHFVCTNLPTVVEIRANFHLIYGYLTHYWFYGWLLPLT